jgi:hypothetical protein
VKFWELPWNVPTAMQLVAAVQDTSSKLAFITGAAAGAAALAGAVSVTRQQPAARAASAAGVNLRGCRALRVMVILLTEPLVNFTVHYG